MGVVKVAENEIQNYNKNNQRNPITNTQLRKIYSMTLETCKKDLTIEGFEYLRMKIMYQCARDINVKIFYEAVSLDNKIKECTKKDGDIKASSIELKKYMESLVAFHKFYIGK